MARSFESTAVRAVERSASLRTTVPAAVAAILGAEPGSTLLWTVAPGSGRVTVTVRRSTDAGPAQKSK